MDDRPRGLPPTRVIQIAEQNHHEQSPSTRHGAAAILALSAALLASCRTPLHLWDAHMTSTTRAASLDVSALEREPVWPPPPASRA